MIYIIIAIAIGYILGSIPFALVIGKVFYQTDVREHGSGNLGGTNAGRVLGKKAGISVIALDILKVIVAIFVATKLPYPGIESSFPYAQVASIWAGFAAALGHCYPVFANFKGGKAVATMFGFLAGITFFTFKDPYMLIVPVLTFFIVLGCFQYVSLASMCAGIASSIYIFITSDTIVATASILLTILVIYRHRSNIQKIINGEENTVTWLPWSKKD